MIIAFLRRTLSLTEVVLSLILNKGDNSSWEQQSQEIFLVSFSSCTWPVYVQPKGINRETIEGINRLSFQQGSCAKVMTLLALFPLKGLFHSETRTKAPNSFLRPHFLLWRGARLQLQINTLEFVFPSGTTQPDFPPPIFRPSSGTRFLWGFYTPTSSTSAKSLFNYSILTLTIIWWTGC